LKTFSMQFITKNSAPNKTLKSCNTNEIVEVSHLKFIGLEIHNALSWYIHIDSVINKLTTVCFMIRSVRPYMSYSSLLKIYFLCFSLYYHMVLYSGGRLPTTRNSFWSIFSVSFYIIMWYYILGTGYLHQETLFDTKKKLFV
jgi:hypothetical protein